MNVIHVQVNHNICSVNNLYMTQECNGLNHISKYISLFKKWEKSVDLSLVEQLHYERKFIFVIV